MHMVDLAMLFQFFTHDISTVRSSSTEYNIIEKVRKWVKRHIMRSSIKKFQSDKKNWY